MVEYVYGLDFGTSTTLMAIPRDGMPQILPIGETENWMPSVVALGEDGNVHVGDSAGNLPHTRQIRSPKTAITNNNFGNLTSPSGKEIEADWAILSILEEVALKAKKLGLNPDGRVRMSCPAMWTGSQRKRLADLAQMAGINTDVDSMLDEPVAACVSWWWNNFYQKNRRQTAKVLIFDLGGGTLDVAIADIYGESIPEITVLAARGIPVAGDSLDFALADFYEERLESEFGLKIIERPDYRIIRDLAIRASRRAKETLSFLESTTFQLLDGDYGDLPEIEISRLDLEMVYQADLRQAMSCVKATLKETYLKSHNHSPEEMKVFASISYDELSKDLEYVVLAGGMSRIPVIREELQRLFPNAIIESSLDSSSVTEAIVMGVANRNEFEDLNIHRPNFNFVVKWIEKDLTIKQEIFYPAFEPLHTDVEIIQGRFLMGFTHTWIPTSNPKHQDAHLFLESVGGRRVNLDIEGVATDNIPLKVVKGFPVRFKIYLDGQINLTDQATEYSLRVKQWPYIRWQSDRVLKESLKINFVEQKISIDPNDKSWLYNDH